MRRLVLIGLFCVFIGTYCFAVTGDVTVEGRLDVTGDSTISGKLGIGTMESGAKLTVAGNIDLTSAGNTVTTASKELVLEQTGDDYGITRLRLRDRMGSAGAIFDTPSLDLVDFGFLPSSGVQSNFRLEHRTSECLAVNTDGEFQFIGPSVGPNGTWAQWFRSGRGATVVAEGNIGVGTIDAQAKLHTYVNNTTTEPSARIQQDGTGDAALRFQQSNGTAQNAAIGLDQNDNKNIKISNTNALAGTTYADTNTMVRIHTESGSEGIIDFNNQSRVRAYLNAATNLANNAWTKIPFDTENYDTKSEFATGTFTAKEDGYYQANARIKLTISNPNASTYVSVAIYAGNPVAACSYGSQLSVATAGSGLTPSLDLLNNNATNVSDVVYLTAGQMIEIWAFQNTGAARAYVVNSTNIYVSIHKIS